MKPNSIAGLLLAAGGSKRFGEGLQKLTEPVGGSPLVTWPLDALLGAGIDPIVVVTGNEAPAVSRALGNRRRIEVHHPHWARGLGSSIALGVREIASHDPDALVVCLADLPGLRSDTVELLIDAFEETPSRDAICVPEFAGRQGHPVLFGASHLDALARLEGDRGARSILDAHRDRIVPVAVGSNSIFTDVDTREDLEAARAR